MTQDLETPEAKKAVFRHLIDLYATGDVARLEEVCAPDYVGHTAAGQRDLAVFRQSILNFHAPARGSLSTWG